LITHEVYLEGMQICATTALPDPKQEVCGHEEPAASAGDA